MRILGQEPLSKSFSKETFRTPLRGPWAHLGLYLRAAPAEKEHEPWSQVDWIQNIKENLGSTETSKGPQPGFAPVWPHLSSFLRLPFSAWTSSGSWDTACSFLSWHFICCSICLEVSHHRYSHCWFLLIIQIPAQMAPIRRSLSYSTDLKSTPITLLPLGLIFSLAFVVIKNNPVCFLIYYLSPILENKFCVGKDPIWFRAISGG